MPMMALMDEPGWELLSKRDIHRGYVTLTEHEVMLPKGDVTRYEVDESAPLRVRGSRPDRGRNAAAGSGIPLPRWHVDL